MLEYVCVCEMKSSRSFAAFLFFETFPHRWAPVPNSRETNNKVFPSTRLLVVFRPIVNNSFSPSCLLWRCCPLISCTYACMREFAVIQRWIVNLIAGRLIKTNTHAPDSCPCVYINSINDNAKEKWFSGLCLSSMASNVWQPGASTYCGCSCLWFLHGSLYCIKYTASAASKSRVMSKVAQVAWIKSINVMIRAKCGDWLISLPFQIQ